MTLVYGLDPCPLQMAKGFSKCFLSAVMKQLKFHSSGASLWRMTIHSTTVPSNTISICHTLAPSVGRANCLVELYREGQWSAVSPSWCRSRLVVLVGLLGWLLVVVLWQWQCQGSRHGHGDRHGRGGRHGQVIASWDLHWLGSWQCHSSQGLACLEVIKGSSQVVYGLLQHHIFTIHFP